MAQVTPHDCSSTCKYPKEKDGWFHSHNAMRSDLKDLQAMLGAFRSQLASGRGITRPQAAAAQRFINCFLKFVHHHHHNEDDIAMPYLATRIKIEERISADHKALVVLLDQLEAGMKSLLAPGPSVAQQQALLESVAGVLGELQRLCLEHFREEEEGPLPAMRQNFTPKEINKHVVSKIMRSMDGDGVGAFLHPMTKEERRGFARQEGIPFFIRWILFRQAANYERKVWGPFERECLRTAPAIA